MVNEWLLCVQQECMPLHHLLPHVTCKVFCYSIWKPLHIQLLRMRTHTVACELSTAHNPTVAALQMTIGNNKMCS